MLKKLLFNTFKGKVFAFVFFGITINLSHFVYPIYMLQVYNNVFSSFNIYNLVYLTAIALFFTYLGGKSDSLRTQLLKNYSLEVEKQIFPILADSLRHSNFENTNETIGDKELQTISLSISQGMLASFFDFLFFPLFLIGMFYIHSYLGWTLIAISIVYLVINLYSILINHPETKPKIISAEVSDRLIDLQENKSVYINFNSYKERANIHLNELSDKMAAKLKEYDDEQVINFVNTQLKNAGQILVLSIGAYLVVKGELSPGLMIIASLLFGRCLSPLVSFVTVAKTFSPLKASYIALEKKISSKNTCRNDFVTINTPNIVLNKVIVSAPNSNLPIIKAISIKIKEGQFVIFKGRTATGKSTLLNAISGSWPISNGSVLIDGVSLHNKPNFGDQLLHFMCDSKIIPGSVRDNLSILKPLTYDQLISGTKKFGIHEYIEKLPNGYDTIIKHNSTIVSPTLLDLICLCRIYYATPKILILDEPTLNIPVYFKKVFYSYLDEINNLGTTIIMASKERVIPSSVDMIVSLSNGVIIDIDENVLKQKQIKVV